MSISLNNHESRIKVLENKAAQSSGGGGFPDYNNATKISANTEYTAATNGFVWVKIGGFPDFHNWHIVVNNIERYHFEIQYTYSRTTFAHPIAKGYKYKVTGSPIGELLWVPEIKYYLISAFDSIRKAMLGWVM